MLIPPPFLPNIIAPDYRLEAIKSHYLVNVIISWRYYRVMIKFLWKGSVILHEMLFSFQMTLKNPEAPVILIKYSYLFFFFLRVTFCGKQRFGGQCRFKQYVFTESVTWKASTICIGWNKEVLSEILAMAGSVGTICQKLPFFLPPRNSLYQFVF